MTKHSCLEGWKKKSQWSMKCWISWMKNFRDWLWNHFSILTLLSMNYYLLRAFLTRSKIWRWEVRITSRMKRISHQHCCNKCLHTVAVMVCSIMRQNYAFGHAPLMALDFYFQFTSVGAVVALIVVLVFSQPNTCACLTFLMTPSDIGSSPYSCCSRIKVIMSHITCVNNRERKYSPSS